MSGIDFGYYHHPVDKQYSLEFVANTARDAKARMEGEDDAKAIGQVFDEEIFCVYTNTSASGSTDDLRTTEEELMAAVDRMNPDDQIFAVRLLSMFEGIEEEKENHERSKLAVYKEIEIENIPKVTSEIDWSGTVVEVAGRIMSNLILKHSLPNANHRTAITMAQEYLEMSGVDFEMPATHTDEFDWSTWVNPYIVESKRLLTVRRNNVRLNALKEAGCSQVLRKGNIVIDLDEYDLDIHYSDAWTRYAEEHERLCIRFAEEAVKLADMPELLNEEAPPRQEFTDYLLEGEPSKRVANRNQS